jgi:metallo-beta-lactamase family protein
VRIHGETIPVNATVAQLESMSAHADSTEILRWLGGFSRPPRTTFLVHGEPVAMEALGASIKTQLGWQTRMPEHRETIELE